MTTYAQYITESVLARVDIDRFLSDEPSWAQFDPEVGYVLGNYMPRDGLDGSSTISTSQPDGARRAAIYADRPRRINTYGNSFTQCHQVSDEETWQEYLAAHLGEPIGNFGMGGFGVYQSYRRMIRTDSGPEGGRYVMLYVWGDDHIRSCLRCRHVLTSRWWNHVGGAMFHGNFWANVEMDLASGRFVEKENLLPTPQSLYKMTDAGWMIDALADDLMLRLSLFCYNQIDDLDLTAINRLAEILHCPPVAADDLPTQRIQADVIRMAYGFAATEYILEKAVAFAAARDKKLLLILLCPSATRQLLEGTPRHDQRVADYIARRGWPCFDMNLVHQQDFKSFRPDVDAYLRRYFIGHYSPAGNHFFAMSIRRTVVDWLDPKPITYADDSQARIGFQNYLPA
ncbi:MAG: hypothetical protein ABFD92_12825 [Planctomycetaceae bacterium]|nr:hypothetical protein [Planctomycetaceae bacterium]